MVYYELASFIENDVLSPFADCFEESQYGIQHSFINDSGRQRLQEEWPEIWQELGL